MNRGRAPGINLRQGFFLDGCDHHVQSLGAGRVENQERKPPIAGD